MTAQANPKLALRPFLPLSRPEGSPPLRAVGGFLLRPWVSVALFSAVMVAWHVPALFDWGEKNQAVHIWLMHGSMLTAGLLFWLQYIPSPPLRIRSRPLRQRVCGTSTTIVSSRSKSTAHGFRV